MRKRVGIMIAALMAAVMVFSITGCGQQSDEDTFEGSLVNAQNNVLVVRDNTAYVRQFYTNDKTVFSYENGTALKPGDSLLISYHQEGSKYVASSVSVAEAQEETLVLQGEVTDLTPATMTVNANSLTVKFTYNDKTQVEGRLTKGDSVRVTYYGDISENPYASEIVVEEEKADAALHKISGIVSEVSGKSILLSVDSADAFRFKLTGDTIIDGKADRVAVGDHVTLVYSGNLKNDPSLHRVEITEKAKKDKQELMVIDGTVEKYTDKTIVINTGAKVYTFKVNKNTQYSGSTMPKKGVKATITYKGKLKEKPVAVAVFCKKVKNQQKETKKTEATKATKETKATKATKETKETEATEVTDPSE